MNPSKRRDSSSTKCACGRESRACLQRHAQTCADELSSADPRMWAFAGAPLCKCLRLSHRIDSSMSLPKSRTFGSNLGRCEEAHRTPCISTAKAPAQPCLETGTRFVHAVDIASVELDVPATDVIHQSLEPRPTETEHRLKLAVIETRNSSQIIRTNAMQGPLVVALGSFSPWGTTGDPSPQIPPHKWQPTGIQAHWTLPAPAGRASFDCFEKAHFCTDHHHLPPHCSLKYTAGFKPTLFYRTELIRDERESVASTVLVGNHVECTCHRGALPVAAAVQNLFEARDSRSDRVNSERKNLTGLKKNLNKRTTQGSVDTGFV